MIAFHGGGGSYNLAALSESDRKSWVTALSNASFFNIKAKMERLKNELSLKLAKGSAHTLQIQMSPSTQQLKAAGYVKG